MLSNLLSPGLSEWWRTVQRRYPPELRDHLNAALSVTEEVPPPTSEEVADIQRFIANASDNEDTFVDFCLAVLNSNEFVYLE